MSLVTVYGLTRCSTCIKARKWLDAQGIAYTFIDYRDQPVPADVLVRWAQQLGGWTALVNRASTSWRGLSDMQKQADSETQWLALIAEFPTLIKRPVIVRVNGDVMLGFSEAKYTDFLQ